MKKNAPGGCGCCGCEIWRVEDVIDTVTASSGYHNLPDLPESGWLIGVKVRAGETPVTGMTIEILDSADTVIAEIPVIDSGTTMQDTVVGSYTIPSGFGLEGFDPDNPLSYDAAFVVRSSGVMAIGSAAVYESISNTSELWMEMGSGWSVGSTTNAASGFWLPALTGTGDRQLRLNPNGQNFGIDIFAFDLSEPAEVDAECPDPHLSKLTSERSQPKWDRGTDNLLPSINYIDKYYGFSQAGNSIDQNVTYPATVEDAEWLVRATFPNNPSATGAYISTGYEPPATTSWRTFIEIQIDCSNFAGSTVDLDISLIMNYAHATDLTNAESRLYSHAAAATANPDEFEYTFRNAYRGLAIAVMQWNWSRTISKWVGAVPSIALAGSDATTISWTPDGLTSPRDLTSTERSTGELGFGGGAMKIRFVGTLSATPSYSFATTQLSYMVDYTTAETSLIPDDVTWNLKPNTLVLPQPS